VINVVKKTVLTIEQLQEILSKAPARNRGVWQELINEVKRTKKPMLVEDVSRGQAWALRRAALQAGIQARVIENGKKVILFV